MVILCDTRQQAGKHKNIDSYLQKRGIPTARTALYVGDYTIANDQHIAVDTKQGVLELIMDMHQDHERFAAECQRAKDAGIRLYILVEETLPGGRIDRWQSPTDRRGNPLTRTDMTAFRESLITMTAKYDVRFRFCDARSTGKVLLELLTGGEV